MKLFALAAAAALLAVGTVACPADAPVGPRPAVDGSTTPAEPGPTVTLVEALEDGPAAVASRAVGRDRWSRSLCRHVPRAGDTPLALAPTLLALGAEPAWPDRRGSGPRSVAAGGCERGEVAACVARAIDVARHHDLDRLAAIAARACSERPGAACKALIGATPQTRGELAPPSPLHLASALRPRCAVGGAASCRALFMATLGPPRPLAALDSELEAALLARCDAGIEPACALLVAASALPPDDDRVAGELEGLRVDCERRGEGDACASLAAALAPHDPLAAADATRRACALSASLDCPAGELVTRCRGGEAAACLAVVGAAAGSAEAAGVEASALEATRARCGEGDEAACRLFAALRLARGASDPAALLEAEVAAASICHRDPERCRADGDALAAEPWRLRHGAALLWRAACEGGDPDACEALAFNDGAALLAGAATGANGAWYGRQVALRGERCAARPSGRDCEHLGRIHEHGCAGAVDLEAATRAYAAGCGRDGASAACVRLAALHVRLWARRACAEGDLPACARLLTLYASGLAVPADPGAVAALGERVIARWSGSCADGDVASCRALFEVPGGVAPADRARVARRVCARDEPRGCELLADLTDDPAEADGALVRASGLHLEWCDHGRPESCLALASMLRRGIVPGARKARDRREALLALAVTHWASRCDAGDGAACVDLGLTRLAAYRPDPEAAFRILSRASGLAVGDGGGDGLADDETAGDDGDGP